MLEPNREVKESYEAIEGATKDGESHQDYRVHAYNRELILRHVRLNKEVRPRRDQIAEQRDGGSLMPPGLVDHLTREELCDPFYFLSDPGDLAYLVAGSQTQCGGSSVVLLKVAEPQLPSK